MNREQYMKYLNSEDWRSTRDRFFASPSVEHVCVVCGSERVQLHHRTYERLGRERLTDLVPLCAEHHTEAHRIRSMRKRPKATATAKQLAYIRRLGGRAPAEATFRTARRMIDVLQRERSRTTRMERA